MYSFKMCTGCSYVFCFIDGPQEACHICGGALRELTKEENELILKKIDGKKYGSCSWSLTGCSC
jgi:hypothetical protein